MLRASNRICHDGGTFARLSHDTEVKRRSSLVSANEAVRLHDRTSHPSEGFYSLGDEVIA